MAAQLGPRDRLLRAIEWSDIDRCPCFFRADSYVLENVKRQLGLRDELDVLRFFGSDAIRTQVPYRFVSEPDESGEHFDMFGNKYRIIQYDGITTSDVIQPVLANATDIDDIGSMTWPDGGIVDVGRATTEAKRARATGLAVYGGVWASIFTLARRIVGEERFLVSLHTDPSFVVKLIERLTDFYLDANEAYLSACGECLDIYYFGSDFGTQRSMFISPSMFRRFYKPQLKRIADQAKSYGLKVMFHTCGAVSAIIPDLIDCGIDVLDPVQVSAKDMGPCDLAGRFKDKIAFHGGISTQTTLPYKTPEEVREEVIRTIGTLGPLGYIVAPDQEMIGDTPVENIVALFEAVRDYQV